MHFAILILLLGVFAVSTGTSYAFCYKEAGSRYGISPNLLYAISKGESSFNPVAIYYNSNGSYDYGLMQINSSFHEGHDRNPQFFDVAVCAAIDDLLFESLIETLCHSIGL